MFQRIEQFLELLRIELRSECHCLNGLDKAKSGAYLGDMGRWIILLGWCVSSRSILRVGLVGIQGRGARGGPGGGLGEEDRDWQEGDLEQDREWGVEGLEECRGV